MNKLYLIRFNDDNHDERIWINGQYAGEITYPKDILEKAMTIVSDEKLIPGNFEIEETTIYVCDDFDNIDEDDEMVDNIWDWFNTVENMTPEQIEKVHNKDWKALNDLI